MKIDNRKTFIKRLLSGTMSKEQRKIFIQLDKYLALLFGHRPWEQSFYERFSIINFHTYKYLFTCIYNKYTWNPFPPTSDLKKIFFWLEFYKYLYVIALIKSKKVVVFNTTWKKERKRAFLPFSQIKGLSFF